ncbi:hypothetical protein [Mycoplasma buteonis]|uniref:hypothetical protein n=1 Tax=Mycoplasma buteonis TaxID=171280 RepID=UPI00056C8184|nr:hypothetical protein [Mycoplasma buteonis]
MSTVKPEIYTDQIEKYLDYYYDSGLGIFTENQKNPYFADYRITAEIFYALKNIGLKTLLNKYRNDNKLLDLFKKYYLSTDELEVDTAFYLLSLVVDEQIKKSFTREIEGWKPKILSFFSQEKFDQSILQWYPSETKFLIFIKNVFENLNLEITEIEYFLKQKLNLKNLNDINLKNLIEANYLAKYNAEFWNTFSDKRDFYNKFIINSKVFHKQNNQFLFYASLFDNVKLDFIRKSITNSVADSLNLSDQYTFRNIKYILKTGFYNKKYRSKELYEKVFKYMKDIDDQKLVLFSNVAKLDYFVSMFYLKKLAPDFEMQINQNVLNSTLKEFENFKYFFDIETLINLVDYYKFNNKEIPNWLLRKINFSKKSDDLNLKNLTINSSYFQSINNPKNIMDFYYFQLLTKEK